MQDFLTFAATATAASFIGFTVFGYIAYVWQRTAPIAAVYPTPVAAPAAPVAPIVAAAIAEPQTALPQPKTVSADVFAPAKPKRGRPRKVAVDSTSVLHDEQAPTQRKRRKAA
jgi:hypothetical protein